MPENAVATTAVEVLDFWFGAPDSALRGRRRKEWFTKSDDFDRAVTARFLRLHTRAAAGELAAWSETPHGLLAFIILCDQLPRNMFRNTARAFFTDAQALAAAQAMLARGWDQQLAPITRWFIYLPFEHAEEIELQAQSLRLFGELAREPELADTLEWARKHEAVIARFGRFPHRNAILGRVSTPEEAAFLQQPGSSF